MTTVLKETFPAIREPGDGIINIVEYRASIPEVIPWIVSGLIFRGGVTLLSGAPKAGKSTLTAGIMASRETGQLFLDLPVETGPTLLVTEEGGIPVRYKTNGLTDLDVYDQKAADGESFDATLRTITQWWTEHQDGLVIIDTFAVWAGVDDENDATKVTAALKEINRLAALTKLGILLVHHTRKGGGQDGEAIRGSGAMLATVDVSAELKRTGDSENSDERYLDTMGRVMMPERFLLGFDRVGRTYVRLDPRVHLLADIERDLEGIPTDGPGLREKETKLSFRRLQQLENLGRIRIQRGGKGLPNLYWAIPPAWSSTARPKDRPEPGGDQCG
jgi:hypothetical protein